MLQLFSFQRRVGGEGEGEESRSNSEAESRRAESAEALSSKNRSCIGTAAYNADLSLSLSLESL